MEINKSKILTALNNTLNPFKVVYNTYRFGVDFGVGVFKASKSTLDYTSNLILDRYKYTGIYLSKLGELQKLSFFVFALGVLFLAFMGGFMVSSVSLDHLPTSFINTNSTSQATSYIPSKGTGAENLTNNAKDTLKNFIELIKGSLKNSDGFLKAVFSERPLYLESDTISINGETLQSPKKLIYGSALGIAYSLVTLFIIFDTIKILTGHGGDFKKLIFKYLLGFLVVSLSGILLNYSIDMANAITKDLLVNNSDPNRSKIGQVLDNYLTSVQASYVNQDRWPWDYWWGSEAGWNPINILKDYVNIAIELIPLIALLVIVLFNGFALLTNWVVMYVLAGIVPIAVCFYMVDWNHSYPKNFINLWVQNLLQLPLFSFVFYTFITFLGGGIVAGNSFKLALFFAFLTVMLNVNQNFGSIFTGFTSQAGSVAGSLFAGLGTSVAGSVGSGTMQAMGKGGIARRVAGGVGSQAMKSGSNFAQGVSTGKGAGMAGRVGQSVNSLGQGMIGNRTSSYVANRLGRVVGSGGIGGSANIANGLRATGSGIKKTKTAFDSAVKNTGQVIQNMKTDPNTASKVGLNPLKNNKN
jgi:hypothetical protein